MTRHGWRPSDADTHRPRFGCTAQEWRGITDLHRKVWTGLVSDWPDGPEPDPRERNPKLCFARYLYREGILHD